METTNNNIDSNSYKCYDNKKNNGISAPEMIQESKRRKDFNERTPNFVKQALVEVSK